VQSHLERNMREGLPKNGDSVALRVHTSMYVRVDCITYKQPSWVLYLVDDDV
jgi:hypothetical protein